MAERKAKADKITTDRQVAALKPKATIYETPIAGVRGFQVRTFPSGTKAFELRYTATNGSRCQTAFKVDPHRRPKLTPSPIRLRAAVRGAMA